LCTAILERLGDTKPRAVLVRDVEMSLAHRFILLGGDLSHCRVRPGRFLHKVHSQIAQGCAHTSHLHSSRLYRYN
jgi:hypothetical protein